MRERRRRQQPGVVHAQVVFRYPAEEVAHESRREGAPRGGYGAPRERGYLLDEGEAGGGNLAEHAKSYSACAGPSSTARPSNTRTRRSSVARSRALSGATRLRSYWRAMGTTDRKSVV